MIPLYIHTILCPLSFFMKTRLRYADKSVATTLRATQLTVQPAMTPHKSRNDAPRDALRESTLTQRRTPPHPPTPASHPIPAVEDP